MMTTIRWANLNYSRIEPVAFQLGFYTIANPSGHINTAKLTEVKIALWGTESNQSALRLCQYFRFGAEFKSIYLDINNQNMILRSLIKAKANQA